MAEWWDMNDIFDKIIAKEIPAQFVYEDDVCIGIMDKFPVVPGQVLIIPKKHVEYIFNLDDVTYVHILDVAKKIALALDTVYNTVRTCMAVEGFEVPHVHVKLYPATSTKIQMHGGFEASDVDLEKEASKIRMELQR